MLPVQRLARNLRAAGFDRVALNLPRFLARHGVPADRRYAGRLYRFTHEGESGLACWLYDEAARRHTLLATDTATCAVAEARAPVDHVRLEVRLPAAVLDRLARLGARQSPPRSPNEQARVLLQSWAAVLEGVPRG